MSSVFCNVKFQSLIFFYPFQFEDDVDFHIVEFLDGGGTEVVPGQLQGSKMEEAFGLPTIPGPNATRPQ